MSSSSEHVVSDSAVITPQNAIVCPKCKKTFTRWDNVKRHIQYSCNTVRQVTKRQSETANPSPSKKKNVANKISDDNKRVENVRCKECDEDVTKSHYRGHLRSNRHKLNACRFIEDEGIEILQSAFQDRLMSYKLSSSKDYLKVHDFMNEFRIKVCDLINKQVIKCRNVKVNCELFGLYTLKQQEVLDIKSFQTKYEIASLGTDYEQLYNKFVDVLDRKESEFQEKDSGWVMVKFLHLEVNFVKFNPLRASSYMKLPKVIQMKKAIINVCNKDECCFGWALASALTVPNGNPQRVTSYPDFRTLCNWEGISFPMKITDIGKFEDCNNISINVYGLEEITDQGQRKIEVVGPLYYTKKKQNTHINLLLVENDVGGQHYCWIKNFSRLVSSQLTTRNGAKHFCDSCLHYFRNKELLQRHVTNDCNYVYTKLPTCSAAIDKTGEITYGNVLKFDNFHKKMSVPFVIYADVESLLVPVHTTLPNPKEPFTVKTCKHEAYAFAYYIKSSENDEWSRLRIYRGEDAAKQFVNWLDADVHEIYTNYLKTVKPMVPLTTQELTEYESAPLCFICNKDFVSPGNAKVRDHSHITGRYRGAAHSTCNLNYKTPNFIPVFFHNLSGYDSHLFIKQLAVKKEEIDVIPQSKEKYISFTKRLFVDRIAKEDGKTEDLYIRLRFLDSYRFMASSLDTLAQTLTDKQCTTLRKFYFDDVKFNLARVKGVFPYSYIDHYTKLSQDCLPKKVEFYDTLHEQHISDEDYERAKNIWTTFECKSLGDYSEVYLGCDVLLLTDVFENFRILCQKIYDLDPAQYFTAPGLTWDAMLKHTQVELELLTDMDMYHFFKKGIRGGVSTCVKRKVLANNPYLTSFNYQDPTSYIMFLDSTNLYGYSMREYLPRTGFAWLPSEAVTSFNVLEISDDADVGYVLEVDLHYPDTLHDCHNDLPFCPENIQPPRSSSSQKKLIPNLMNKTAYVMHYRNLKQCLKHGLVLMRTHRILRFQQSPWLRNYIDLNTRLRIEASTKFEKDFYKLMNNGVFGKTMENVDKRRNIRLLTHWENIGKRLGLEAYVAKPTFKQLTRFTEKLYALELSKTAVLYNKPVYVGFTILDISKIVIYRFFYDVLRSRYDQNVRLLYTDTDSLVVEIQTPDVYEDIKMQLNEYDTSNYDKNNQHNIPITTSVVGKMKDEYAGKLIRSFYGAGAKSYCVNVEGEVVKKAKGVRKYVIQRDITEQDFKRVAEGDTASIFCKMYVFRSTLHDLYTELVNKIALCSYDDKRFVIPGTCNTLAWGHRDIDECEMRNNRLNSLIRSSQDSLRELHEENGVTEYVNTEFLNILESSWNWDTLPLTDPIDLDQLINEHVNHVL